MVDEVSLPQRPPRSKRRRGAETDQPAEQSVLVGGQPTAAEAEQGQTARGDWTADDATPSAPLRLQEYRSAAVPGFNFEWGRNLREAFEGVALAMFNYMTPLSGIGVDEHDTKTYEADGHDLQSLLFQFLDELLFTFSTEFFVCKELHITTFDLEGFRIVAEGRGEKFNRSRHACGTEVKAITYSAMQINEKEGDAEVFVIVDI
ncbi:hypothetical protein N2152v2_006257 [Parachlorella kessleri]